MFAFVLLGTLHASAQITFIENKGQWEDNVKYKADIPGGVLFIEDGQLTYLLAESEPFKKMHETGIYDKPVKLHAYKLKFENFNPKLTYQPEQKVITQYNYFIGNDPSKWANNVNGFNKVTLKNIYKGVDLEIFGSTQTSIKYNLIVQPGANPDIIKMRYEGLDKLEIENGQLHLHTSIGEIHEHIPLAYQIEGSELKKVKTSYKLENNILSFDIKDRINRRKSFIIDPVVVFSTYSGSLADNWGFTATWDDFGNAYGGGTVYGFGYPTTTGAFQRLFKNGVDVLPQVGDLARDAAIYKVTDDGSTLLFATYLGGNHNEQPHSMIVNSKGELVILGTTFSNNFPTSNTAYDRFHAGQSDIYVFILSGNGQNMIASTFIGGSDRDGLNGRVFDANQPNESPIAYNYGDQFRGEVIVDKQDNIYIASCTQSDNSEGFPLVNAFQPTFGGGRQDGCIIMLTPDVSNILWSSYVGGNDWDACYGLDLDANDNLFAAGGSTSGIPEVTAGSGVVTTFSGGRSDGFLLKINPQMKVAGATYAGTPDYDQAYFVKVDKYNNPYITGQTSGTWTASADIYSTPNGGQFICKYTNDLSQLTRSMVFGNGTVKPQISPSAFLVDECERIFVSGWGGRTNTFPQGHGGNTSQMFTTADAFQKNTDGSDFYLTVFSKNLEEPLYASFFGGGSALQPQGEHVDGGTSRFDSRGIVYQSVCGGCGGNSLFPTTNGSHSPTNKSQNCNNAVFKVDFENLNRAPEVNDKFFSVVATEELSFEYLGTDIDKYDTLFLDVDESEFSSPKFPGIKPTITYPKKGLREMRMNFSWQTACEHFTGDTIFMKVHLRDLGCPDYKEDSATIKILVTEPPTSPPPDVLCVVPSTPNSILLRWDNVDTSSDFFSHFMIKKVDPQGNEFNLGPFNKSDKFEYTDFAVNDYRNQNYCYYIYAVNKCGKKGANSYTVCTKDQFNSPINTTKVVTATVEDNKNVKLVWFDTKEDDFESYLIYRSPRTAAGHSNYEFYGSTTETDDTIFIDKGVNVQNESFCYRIQVTDQCGHISKFSNIGCNIVLRGASEPYLHRLNWNDYENWENGIDNYELIRWDDRKNPSQIYQGAPAVLNHNDEQLDYDWGAYWYKVVAYENGGNFAESQSNEVRLIQRPLLHVPTAFTPTGDNLNDTWGQVDVFVKDYHMQVYNRWGQKVFESYDKNEQWNGSFARKGPADNVFIWIVRYTGWDNSIHHQKGTVTILN